jgi:hypothetical protein
MLSFIGCRVRPVIMTTLAVVIPLQLARHTVYESLIRTRWGSGSIISQFRHRRDNPGLEAAYSPIGVLLRYHIHISTEPHGGNVVVIVVYSSP